ncbi:MAG: hypothetical protein IJ565_06620 [Bacilli bacterium]|nr:hypothetical protein [Bacilli bacterium]
MNGVLIGNENYELLGTLNVFKYEYVLLSKNGNICYAEEKNNTYEIPNTDLTLQGNANTPLSNLNSRIIMEQVKKVIENDIKIENKINVETIDKKLNKIQETLQKPELYNLIKGNVDELYHFDEEVNKMVDKFNELNNEITTVMPPIIEPLKSEYKAVKDDLNEQANVDAFMIAIIVNIGILLLIMFILNIIR